MRGLGTIINVATILAGSAVGLLLGGRLPARIRDTVLAGVGLLTLGIGVESFLATENAVIPVVSVAVGAAVGSALRLEDRLEDLGEWLRRRFAPGADDAEEGTVAGGRARFVEGFATASLIFVVGPLAILGAFTDGLGGGTRLLVVKATLDGLVSIAFAAAYGVGVAFSALPVAVLQGLLTLAGVLAGGEVLTPRMVAELEAAGGVMILGIGVRLLDLRRIPVADFLPGLVVAPALVAVFVR